MSRWPTPWVQTRRPVTRIPRDRAAAASAGQLRAHAGSRLGPRCWGSRSPHGDGNGDSDGAVRNDLDLGLVSTAPPPRAGRGRSAKHRRGPSRSGTHGRRRLPGRPPAHGLALPRERRPGLSLVHRLHHPLGHRLGAAPISPWRVCSTTTVWTAVQTAARPAVHRGASIPRAATGDHEVVGRGQPEHRLHPRVVIRVRGPHVGGDGHPVEVGVVASKTAVGDGVRVVDGEVARGPVEATGLHQAGRVGARVDHSGQPGAHERIGGVGVRAHVDDRLAARAGRVEVVIRGLGRSPGRSGCARGTPGRCCDGSRPPDPCASSR